MKPIPILAATLLIALPILAQGQEAATGTQSPAPMAAPVSSAPAGAKTQAPQAAEPRRSRMAEVDDDRPDFKLSAIYRVRGDTASRDHCLKETGTRIRRDGDGNDACAIGNGQVFIPER